MLRRISQRLSYANVTATLALFVALGGSSYAAIKLPSNSVGPRQIRTGAVGSSEIHDRSVHLKDLTVSTRNALKGQKGDVGAPGAAGPAGAAAVKYFATVSPAGEFLRGNANSGGHAGSTGSYVVGFPASVSACSYSATLGTADSTATQAGRVTVNDQGGKVGVQTFDAAGSPADLPFHLLVAC
jgi:hypothetical protein